MPADELLQACAAAPRFGVNAKAIILQAAAEVDEEEEPPVPPQLDDPRQQEWECLARAAEFLEAVDPRLRPLVTYVPRSKLPRAARQTVVTKLAGQHLALAAMWQGQLEPAAAAGLEGLRARAFAFAMDQEAELFRRCMGVGVYQNKAAQLTALDWDPALATRPALEPVREPSLPRPRPGTKRPRRLQEADLDWEAARPEEEEGDAGQAVDELPGAAAASPLPAPSLTPHTVLGEAGVEALPVIPEQVARELLGRAMATQLASLAGYGWSLTEAVQEGIVARCASKVLRGREAGDANAILRDEHSSVRNLVWKEVQACLARTLRALDVVGEKPALHTDATRDVE
ncbi:hypothetical protein ACKKBF_B15570 [Auxenochlorella protothecoides x Auxenochlorella symbiontica]